MPTHYVETSALLRAAFEGDFALHEFLGAADRSLTSALTRVEADRAVHRAFVTERFPQGEHDRARRRIDDFLANCVELMLDANVLSRARRYFPVEPVRTLDALHLATVLGWDRPTSD